MNGLSYQDIMHAVFNCDGISNDVMDAFEEADPLAFERFCREQIRDAISCESFIKEIGKSGKYYGMDYNNETYGFVVEIYNDEMIESDIKEMWDRMLEKETEYAFD